MVTDKGGHSDPRGRRSPPAWREPPYGRSAVERPRKPFWLSHWAGGRPPEGRPPAQRETPPHEEAGSKWSRRSGYVRRVQWHPSRISVSAKQTLKYKVGPSYGGPCSAHAIGMGTAGAPRGPTTPHTAILFLAGRQDGGMGCQNPHGGAASCAAMEDSAGQRKTGRGTASFPVLTAAEPPRSECPEEHRQPVGGAPASPAPAVLDRRGQNDPQTGFPRTVPGWTDVTSHKC
ncbi:hypothetical protein NDU88_007230 [Pleurodeles waltl]|uniref:Uncharacterized protein n=1 Tax=Pleurodeles waltl TaxID=8319 RepID=A0AAV7UN92_PLEWA|nr:hypothetical protein NDU88_007230 [Pleurodeles waltl]